MIILKLDIFNSFKDLHPENVISIFLVFNILKVERLIEVNFIQLLNIECISTTFDILEFDKSIDNKELPMYQI